jgi:hypothetical protein
MATTGKAKIEAVEKTPLDRIKEYQELAKAETDKLIGQLQRQLQEVADVTKLANEITGRCVLSDPAFEQALNDLGVAVKGSIEAPVKKAPKELPPIGGTPLAKQICEALKKHNKPMDIAAIVTAVGGKKSTVTNYTNRLVGEGVIDRPARGMFASK